MCPVGMADAADAADATMGQDGRQAGAKRAQRLRKLHRSLFFARQFQMPDWMTEVPEDLATNWLVMVRPEGERCLLLSDGGRVQVRRKNGFIHERFTDSRLPRGLTILDVVCIDGPPTGQSASSRAHGDGAGHGEAEHRDGQDDEEDDDIEDVEVADVDMGAGRRGGRKGCARGGAPEDGRGRDGKGRGKGRRRRPQGDRSYAVCDVLVWADTDLAGAEAECRMFWLASRVSELREKSRRARPLLLIPAVPATPEALLQAYQADVGYAKDSLLFLHREGHYCVSEPVTPLALMWRDRHISRFVVDTPDEKGEVLPERQAVVLEMRAQGWLRTAERIIVGQLEDEQLNAAQQLIRGKGPRAKALLRCEVQRVDVAARRLLGVQPVGYVAAQSRVWADSWGRIVFQHIHRAGEVVAISFAAVSQAAGKPTSP